MTVARMTRVKKGVMVMLTAKMRFPMPLPSAATMDRENSSGGRHMNTSTMRMTMVSSRPPK